jgi:diguanylate cyclase (GGDEF)-like protein
MAGAVPPESLLTEHPVPPHHSGPAALVTPVVLTLLAVAAAIAGTLADLRAPTATDWHIVTVLAAVALMGVAVGYRFNPPDDEAAPPWDVHSVWVLPAALLTPPAAFGVLVVLSVGIALAKRAHPLRWRLVVACTTLLTTAAVHASTQLIGNLALAGLAGIAALWLIGATIAVTVARVIGTPGGTVLWLDDRWSFVELGCAFSALLIAAAMRTDPNLGLAGLAPLLLAAFALRWPELSRHARIDPKTGLPNAWHWEERTRELMPAAELRNTPVAVMIIDLDRFKQVNDTYGHLAGDQVLTELATAMQDEIRPGDLIGRFGGEEFVVTTFGLDTVEALAQAERIRSRVCGRRLHLEDHREGGPADGRFPRPTVGRGSRPAARPSRATGRLPSVVGTATGGPNEPGDPTDPTGPGAADPPGQNGAVADGYTVTCTIGLACSDDHGYDLTRLLDLADTALAAGKVGGRNQVCDARSILATAGAVDEPAAGGRPRSIWTLVRRQRTDRRTLRHGPGSLFR